jgi:alpha-L-fucosidase 2
MTYLPYHAAGLTEAGLSFINMCWDRLPVYRQFARDFFGVEGAAIASVATLAGKPTGGWAPYSLTAPNGLWVGHSFYLHWRYTMDDEFLRTRAYPWLSEISTGIVNLLEERDGKLYLPLSSSPEIHDNSLRAWLPPNSNYDLALMQWAFDALTEMAGALGLETEAGHWRELRAKLDPLAVDDAQVLMFSREEPFTQSHRHHSHTMAIHPLGRLHIEQGDPERAIITATLDGMIDKGTQAWTGYSFSWFAGMLARCGRPDEALRFLSDYERAFTLRNGFHANGDQLGIGLSGFRYRPFTLEGNFLAMDAVHEMLLQSWAPDQDGPHAHQPLIRLFPSTPSTWEEASFEKLRAEGGYLVSARRRDQATLWFRIQATRDGTVRLLDNFDGGRLHFTRGNLDLVEGAYQGAVRPGDIVEAVVLPP